MRAYPTWVIDGQQYQGGLSLDRLAELSKFRYAAPTAPISEQPAVPATQAAQRQPLDVRSLAGTWKGTLPNGGPFTWTIREDGTYETFTHPPTGQSVRGSGRIVADGSRLRWSNDRGTSGSLTLETLGAELVLKATIDRSTATFEARKPLPLPATEPSQSTGPQVVWELERDAGCFLSIVTGRVSVSVDLTDEIVARKLLADGKVYLLGRCPRGVGGYFMVRLVSPRYAGPEVRGQWTGRGYIELINYDNGPLIAQTVAKEQAQEQAKEQAKQQARVAEEERRRLDAER